MSHESEAPKKRTKHPGFFSRLLSPFHVLPNFLIIGTQKGGTNSLYRYLRAHPAVLPGRKGIHFFDLRFGQGVAWYRAHFPLSHASRRVTRLHGTCLTGEGTASYMFHPLAAQRAATVVPGARIIALLRDPVKRAYSHYQHNLRRGREPLDFAQALAAEPQRLAGERERLLADATYPGRAFQQFAYRERGHYAEQLRAWFNSFPASQILVIRSEDLFSKPEASYRRVTEFLKLPEAQLPKFEVFNSGGQYAGLDPGLEEELRAYFRPLNQELAALLGTAEAWWP